MILDSDSSLLPKAIMEGTVGQSTIGKKARLNSDAYPKLKNAASKNNTAIVVISQFREKVGVMFGSPETTQGGHALKFYSDIRVEVRKSVAKEGDEVYGNKTKIKIIKNKLFPPHKTAEFDIVFGKGIDRDKEIFEYAVEAGIVVQSGSWYSYNDDKLGQGASSVLALLKDNPALLKEIEERLLTTLKEAA
jgi:recombination protein RecA